MTKDEKLKGLIRKTEEELDAVFWSDTEKKCKVLNTFFELVKDVVEEKI